jgi:putative solute:sodium symporter small subunit
MINDRRKRRRASATTAQHQHVVATLKRTVMVMLPVWLIYFFVINLFIRSLNAITVPYVDMPLGTYLVIQGCVVAFPILLFLLTRAFAAANRQ